jgi:hypothetical protein
MFDSNASFGFPRNCGIFPLAIKNLRGQSFLGPNGEAYLDESKAFAAHAGLRPCSLCKNNKQGVSQYQVFCFSIFEMISNSLLNTLCDYFSSIPLSIATKAQGP